MNDAIFERAERFAAPASPQDVRHLRQRVAKTLADWGVADRADDVLSSCAEMLANALAYGQTAILTVRLSEQDGWLHLAVPDRNPHPPFLQTADRDDEDGRGVTLLAALSDAWGFRAVDGGKCVFAEFHVDALDGYAPPPGDYDAELGRPETVEIPPRRELAREPAMAQSEMQPAA